MIILIKITFFLLFKGSPLFSIQLMNQTKQFKNRNRNRQNKSLKNREKNK